MPYRARGKMVEVKRGRRWRPYRTCTSKKKAEALAAKLNIEVTKKEKR